MAKSSEHWAEQQEVEQESSFDRMEAQHNARTKRKYLAIAAAICMATLIVRAVLALA